MDQPWKMLVYITADNTLYNDALVSLRQLTDASLPNNVEIIVQLDGPTSDQVSRYRCAAGQKELLWEAPNGYTSDRSERLQHFLGLVDTTPPGAMNSYAIPTQGQRIALDLWGHGAGLDHVYYYAASDDKSTSSSPKTTTIQGSQSPAFSNANLYVRNIQLADILSKFKEKLGHNIDLLALDSCLMAMVEICHEVSSSVSLMVASDEEVPAGSFPYDSILGDLNKFPGMDASILSGVIIDKFIAEYTQKARRTRVSLSTMSLPSSKDLVEAMKKLVDAMTDASNPQKDKDGTVKRTIFRARDASYTPDEVTYIDFGVFCKELSKSSFPSYPGICDLAKNVFELLLKSPYLLYHRDAGEDGSIDPYGLAIYFPPTIDRITSQIDAALKSNQGNPRVMPRDDVKTPGVRGGKTPGVRGGKDTGGPQIMGYEILWGDYLKLKFNQETGWAQLICALLRGNSDQVCGAPPKVAA
jgi:hypothetical protein